MSSLSKSGVHPGGANGLCQGLQGAIYQFFFIIFEQNITICGKTETFDDSLIQVKFLHQY